MAGDFAEPRLAPAAFARSAEPGKARCRFHGGKSTGPKTQAGRARIAEAQRLRWRHYRETDRKVSSVTSYRYTELSPTRSKDFLAAFVQRLATCFDCEADRRIRPLGRFQLTLMTRRKCKPLEPLVLI
jgi:hypothetical protein